MDAKSKGWISSWDGCQYSRDDNLRVWSNITERRGSELFEMRSRKYCQWPLTLCDAVKVWNETEYCLRALLNKGSRGEGRHFVIYSIIVCQSRQNTLQPNIEQTARTILVSLHGIRSV